MGDGRVEDCSVKLGGIIELKPEDVEPYDGPRCTTCKHFHPVESEDGLGWSKMICKKYNYIILNTVLAWICGSHEVEE